MGDLVEMFFPKLNEEFELQVNLPDFRERVSDDKVVAQATVGDRGNITNPLTKYIKSLDLKVRVWSGYANASVRIYGSKPELQKLEAALASHPQFSELPLTLQENHPAEFAHNSLS